MYIKADCNMKTKKRARDTSEKSTEGDVEKVTKKDERTKLGLYDDLKEETEEGFDPSEKGSSTHNF